MDEEQLLNLFDSNWFYNDIIATPSFATNPDLEFPFKPLKPEITRIQSSLLRSVSEDLQSQSSFTSSSSPDSVLRPHQLQTINSGKQVSEEEEQKPDSSSVETRAAASNKLMIKGKRMKKMKSSKSLSDLEFEELKGFMDLGFVFSEEDKNSSLVSIIPGLQRLGKKENLITEAQEEEDKSFKPARGEDNKSVNIQRPYLSEAWAVLDNKTKEEELTLINWQVPKLDNEIAMKYHLRNWAHTVASAVVMLGSSSISLSSCKMAGASPASQSLAAESTQVTTSATSTPQVDATQETQQVTHDPAAATEPKKKGKVRLKVWNDLTRLNNKQAQCKHCKKKLQEDSRGNGTSSMKTHLGTCPENPNKKLKGQQSLLFPPPRPGQSSQLVVVSYDKDMCRRRLAEFVIIDELPFRIV
ncbi:hypothetical protein C5167_049019 [Papaver somniferum]|uniref:BED-type domain-containing protein n=1 Tax=Papaver somniferum TaxID=3469 RepID=A0A4Y7KMC1_PAPSO|nr:hypothetical protein C5167_049019 [Papaver somniferum]